MGAASGHQASLTPAAERPRRPSLTPLPPASASSGSGPPASRLQGHKVSVQGTQPPAGLQHGDAAAGHPQEPVQLAPSTPQHAPRPGLRVGTKEKAPPPASPSSPSAGQPLSPAFRKHSPPVSPTGDVLELLGRRPPALCTSRAGTVCRLRKGAACMRLGDWARNRGSLPSRFAHAGATSNH